MGGSDDFHTLMGSFEESEYGAAHCNQWGNLWHWFAKMCEAIQLPFGVVSGVRPRKGKLDGVQITHSFRGFIAHRLLWGFALG